MMTQYTIRVAIREGLRLGDHSATSGNPQWCTTSSKLTLRRNRLSATRTTQATMNVTNKITMSASTPGRKFAIPDRMRLDDCSTSLLIWYNIFSPQ